MTEKQIIDRLDSINLSLKQKKDLLDVIKDITANSGGGNGSTSTDKDALDIYINMDNNILTVNDKQFNMGNIGSGATEIANKELYDILYNSLINTYRPVFIKTPPNSSLYIFGYATCVYMDNTITLSIYNGDLSLVFLVHN